MRSQLFTVIWTKFQTEIKRVTDNEVIQVIEFRWDGESLQSIFIMANGQSKRETNENIRRHWTDLHYLSFVHVFNANRRTCKESLTRLGHVPIHQSVTQRNLHFVFLVWNVMQRNPSIHMLWMTSASSLDWFVNLSLAEDSNTIRFCSSIAPQSLRTQRDSKCN